MGTVKAKIGFTDKAQQEFEKTEKALQIVAQNVVADTKATNTYMVVSDGKGGIKKIHAKDL